MPASSRCSSAGGWPMPFMRHEQHDAVAGAAMRIVKAPFAVPVEADQRLHPGIAAIEVGPLVGKAQMHFDDACADRLEVDHAGVSGEMLAAPCIAPLFDGWMGAGLDFPVIERPFAAGEAACMSPPARHAVDYGKVAADMLAFQQCRPEMTRPVSFGIVLLAVQPAAADAHAFEIVDRLGKHRIGRRRDAMWGCCQFLA